MRRKIDILCAGELLIDMITDSFVQTLDEAVLFRRLPGGSPANLCMNMARLGNQAMLSASVGKDEMGEVLVRYIASLGIDTKFIARVEEPTTLILVTRSAEVSNFQAYRGADAILSPRQFPLGKLEDISIFHTTCFGLSLNPARNVILEIAEKMNRTGSQLSLDANYSEKIWTDTKEAKRVISDYCRMGAWVKVSEVDWQRIYGEKAEPQAVLDHFLRLQAKEVCLTLGGDGCWVANDSERHFIPARPVQVVDTTGAGDAFWSGYLTARLDGKSIQESAKCGRKMAEIKLAVLGPLMQPIDRSLLYADLENDA